MLHCSARSLTRVLVVRPSASFVGSSPGDGSDDEDNDRRGDDDEDGEDDRSDHLWGYEKWVWDQIKKAWDEIRSSDGYPVAAKTPTCPADRQLKQARAYVLLSLLSHQKHEHEREKTQNKKKERKKKQTKRNTKTENEKRKSAPFAIDCNDEPAFGRPFSPPRSCWRCCRALPVAGLTARCCCFVTVGVFLVQACKENYGNKAGCDTLREPHSTCPANCKVNIKKMKFGSSTIPWVCQHAKTGPTRGYTQSAKDDPTRAKPPPITRHTILERAAVWINERVRYSQRRMHGNPAYRTDCTGFVSMAFDLPQWGTTSFVRGALRSVLSRLLARSLAHPRALFDDVLRTSFFRVHVYTVVPSSPGGGVCRCFVIYFHCFVSYKDEKTIERVACKSMLPGDAMVSNGHIALFRRWVDKSSGKMEWWEERGTAYGAVAGEFSITNYDDLSSTATDMAVTSRGTFYCLRRQNIV